MNCKICNSKKIKTIRHNKLKLGLCQSCNVCFITKIKKDIEKIYTKDYYKSWNIIDKKKETITKQIKYKTFNFLLNLINVKKEKNILDVGCAVGYLLDIAKKKGLKTYGIELSTWACEIARKKGHNIFNGKIEDYKTNIKFDYITLTDILEHVEFPEEFLVKINSLLNKKGKIIITTPLHTSTSRRIFRKYWFQYKEEHLYYFSKKSLKYLAKKANLKIKTIEHNKKTMNYLYFHSQFTTYYTPIISEFFKITNYILPDSIKKINFKIPISGEVLIILEK